MLVHVVTEKGHGYAPASMTADKLHAVSKFDVVTGAQAKAKAGPPTYTKVLRRVADPGSRGRRPQLSSRSPARCRPAQASTCSARPSRTAPSMSGSPSSTPSPSPPGMATEGMKPFATIYSTFLQRAYDQVVHDVAIQSLPVRFAIDRAGLVGADGATHAGSFDVTYLCCRCPASSSWRLSDEAELKHMIATAVADRRRSLRHPLSARRGHRRRFAGARHSAGNRQRPDRPRRRPASRSFASAPACRNA